jgi:hypothetical protein
VHPHILPVFDWAATDCLYVMPYVDGETLRGTSSAKARCR